MPTELLKRAFDKVSALPDYGQDAIADALQWDTTFAQTPEKLDKIAQRALAEYRAGRTEPLDPDKL